MTAATHGDGTLAAPEGSRAFEGRAAEGLRAAVVASRYHSEVVQRLVDGAYAAAARHGIGASAVDLLPAPGAFELGLLARQAAASGRYAVVAALGCVIRGETDHYAYVCSEAARGILLAGLETGVPVGFGLLTCDTPEQAWARAGGAAGNKGDEAMDAALQTAATIRALRTR